MNVQTQVTWKLSLPQSNLIVQSLQAHRETLKQRISTESPQDMIGSKRQLLALNDVLKHLS